MKIIANDSELICSTFKDKSPIFEINTKKLLSLIEFFCYLKKYVVYNIHIYVIYVM